MARLCFENPTIAWAVADSAPIDTSGYPEFLSQLTRMTVGGGKIIVEASPREPGAAIRLIDALIRERQFHFAVRTCAVELDPTRREEARAALARLLTPPLLLPHGLGVLERVLGRPCSVN